MNPEMEMVLQIKDNQTEIIEQQRAEIERLTKELKACPTREWEHCLQMALREKNEKIERLQGELVSIKEKQS